MLAGSLTVAPESLGLSLYILEVDIEILPSGLSETGDNESTQNHLSQNFVSLNKTSY